MHSLLLDGVLFAVLSFYILNRKTTGEFIKDFVTVGEDLWSWTTCTGELYEDVEVQEIAAGEVLIRHKFGTARLPISRLSESSRGLLLRTGHWQDYVSAGPVAGKVRAFAPAHAEAA